MSTAKKKATNNWSPTATSKRPPFEKVKFHSDVKVIYTRTVREAVDFYVKPENQPLFGFKPESYNEKWGLFGQMIVFEDPAPTVSDNCMVNFQLGEDRYFTNGEFRPTSETAILRMIGSLYKLERRGHLRINLLAAKQRDCNFTMRGSKAIFKSAEIINISQGGMKVAVTLDGSTPPFAAGEIVRTFIHINKRWNLEIEGVIRHSKIENAINNCGVQFTSTNENDRRKLISLLMDLQRRYNIE